MTSYDVAELCLLPFLVPADRALTNAIGNLELCDEYVETLKKLGYEYDDVAEQVSSRSLVFGCFKLKFYNTLLSRYSL